MRGVFITFEGPEGSGKSSHVRLLKERLEARGREVLLTREPGGTPLGENIRGLLQHDHAGEPPVDRAEVMLFLASRAQLCERVIRPALDRGAWVVCDRFSDSTLAYQGHGRGFDVDTLRVMNTFATADLVPDLTILLDIPPGIGFARIGNRQKSDRIENAGLEFHTRLRDGFLQLAAAEPNRFAVISTDADFDSVADTVWRATTTRFPLS